MRLTLRTLLAYLDDTLEPSQARTIGQKVAESESARELIERIKQVTRRRRLTTPPTSGPGSIIDPNTVAEYLDNEVTAEQAAEVEQICLSSDVHLAEVAACHQILTLILGEPVKPSVSASQRMVGLVKGPGAIAVRRPASPKARPPQEAFSENKEIDETLRLGLPALGSKGGWRNPLVLIGGGFLAAVLLMVAVFQVLHLPADKEAEAKTVSVAKVNDNEGKTDQVETAKDAIKPGTHKQSSTTPNAAEKQASETGEKKATPDQSDALKGDMPAAAVVAFGPPNPRQAPIGTYVFDPKENSILLQSFPESKLEWKRLTGKQADVLSARPLLSLPSSRSVVQTNRGIRVTLWGNMPEFIAAVPVFESLVELYSHDVFDLDLLLQRGRVVLTSTRQDKPVKIRLRFENPLIPSDKTLMLRQEFFDIELSQQGASLLVDRWSAFPSSEPFYKDPKNPLRHGPTADMVLMVLEGTIFVRTGDLTYRMNAPPGPALMVWNSLHGAKSPAQIAKPLDFALDNAALSADPKARKEMAKACDNLSAKLERGNVDVVLFQEKLASDPSMRRLVVRSLAAVSDLANLLDTLDQPNLPDLRLAAIDALRTWVAASRDNDYKLFELLKEKYKNKEAEIIMEMMHSFSEAEIRRPERYELLIDYLVNPNLVIRELGIWHLRVLVPAGRAIPYSAAADSQQRAKAEALWRALIPPGQLPPAVAPAGKKK